MSLTQLSKTKPPSNSPWHRSSYPVPQSCRGAAVSEETCFWAHSLGPDASATKLPNQLPICGTLVFLVSTQLSGRGGTKTRTWGREAYLKDVCLLRVF